MAARLGEVKRYFSGTHRTVAPRTTIIRAKPLLQRAGITRVANLTGLDYVGVPVAMAVRPQSLNLSTLHGKGLTIEAAVASAIMEAVESRSSEVLPGSAIHAAPSDFCSGEECVFPLHLALRRVSLSERRCWAPAQDLLRNRVIYVPDDLVVARFDARRRARLFASSTNGLAAGNSPMEAAVHAICELIERDAFAIWSLRSVEDQARSEIDLTSVSDGGSCAVLEQFFAAKMTVRAWDITSDLCVPCFACVIDDARTGRPPFLGQCAGTGCHPDPGVALMRALVEAAQSRVGLIAGMRDDLTPANYSGIGWHGNIGSLISRAPRQRPMRRFDSGRGFATRSLASDLAALLQRLGSADVGCVALVDLTLPDLGIPAVRAVAPQLEGMHNKGSYRPGPRARRFIEAP